MPYAYVGSQPDSALTIFDVSNVDSIVHKGFISGAGPPNYLSNVTSIYVVGGLAFLTAYSDNALGIFDISSPASPSLVDSIQGAGAPYYLSGAKRVFVLVDYAYVVSQVDMALSIIDISTPATIVFKGFIQGSGSPNYLNTPMDVFVRGDYAYVTSYNDHSLSIFDISDPTAPTLAAVIRGSGSPNFLGGARGVWVDGDYAYVACYAQKSLTIIDISTPSSPTFKGYVTHSWLDSASRVKVVGDTAWVSSWGGTGGGVVVVDVTDRANPAVLNGTGALGGPNGLDVQGDYLYVPGYATDRLHIFDISDTGNQPVAKDTITGAGDPNYLNGAYDVVAEAAAPALRGGLNPGLAEILLH